LAEATISEQRQQNLSKEEIFIYPEEDVTKECRRLDEDIREFGFVLVVLEKGGAAEKDVYRKKYLDR
jgi:hypothetical protein